MQKLRIAAKVPQSPKASKPPVGNKHQSEHSQRAPLPPPSGPLPPAMIDAVNPRYVISVKSKILTVISRQAQSVIRQNRQKIKNDQPKSNKGRPDQLFYNHGSQSARRTANTANRKNAKNQNSRTILTMALKDALKINTNQSASKTDRSPSSPTIEPVTAIRTGEASEKSEEVKARELPKNAVRFPSGPPDIKTKGFSLKRAIAEVIWHPCG